MHVLGDRKSQDNFKHFCLSYGIYWFLLLYSEYLIFVNRNELNEWVSLNEPLDVNNHIYMFISQRITEYIRLTTETVEERISETI